MKRLFHIYVLAILFLPGISAGDDIHTLLQEAKKAGVPDNALEAIVTRAQARGLSEGSIASLVNVALDAGREGLYIEPILDKIQEGLAKNARPEAIERVSRRVMSRVSEAEESLEGFLPSLPQKHMVIDAILEARERGVSNADVRGILSAASSGQESSRDPERVIAAVDGTARLVSARVEGDAATELMKEALSRGFNKNELMELTVDLAHVIGSLERREKSDVFSSTLEMVREGDKIQTIRESIRAKTALPEGTLGAGKGIAPADRGKEGISPAEFEREHDIPKPAPR